MGEIEREDVIKNEDFASYMEVKNSETLPITNPEYKRKPIVDCPWCNKPIENHELQEAKMYGLKTIHCDEAKFPVIISQSSESWYITPDFIYVDRGVHTEQDFEIYFEGLEND